MFKILALLKVYNNNKLKIYNYFYSDKEGQISSKTLRRGITSFSLDIIFLIMTEIGI
jgi:hypothetical protein